ncbi:MAG TPA: hypothetical protein VFI84_03015 [Candidatus Saccharimonadales bacterium]|nr:hypothetical protein [Candidatus Saccharimonadales bacterium]
MEPTLNQWNGLQWKASTEKPIAHCPKHKGMQLDVLDDDGDLMGQENLSNIEEGHTTFVCPVDDEQFSKNNDIWTLRRRYVAFMKSHGLKNARIVDLDNVYTPILKVEPKPKDDRYSIQVEVDETANGKKLVIYALDRKEKEQGKTQIFIDPETDKVSFDSNDLHPNMIFSKVVAYFKDGKSVSLEADHQNKQH